MTLGEIRDWLRSLELAEHYYIGRLDGRREKSLGVYGRPGRKGTPVIALGGIQNSSYDVKSVSLLLHWNRNARETEAAAVRLWEAVAMAAGVDTPGGGRIQYVRPTVPGPVGVGRDREDNDGVYEYVIDLDIYYARRN